ncbi:MAG TPA: TIGR03619 family F420-dependent LLM class oxidoreductase [Thermomicrobiaceae bacterium]|nr:TIGR03619 family F420-dependent LLM class oxidoreductase [Thermomicrobiaceae bacterium]
MRFGVSLPTYPAGATIEGFTAVARAAESLGFVSAWATDHVILPADHSGPYGSIFEPLETLAYLAALTSQVRLGISVIVVPQRNGVLLAKELATLDQLARGRLIAGVGVGWSEAEFSMLGAGGIFHERGKLLDETLRLWQHLWTEPETPFRGRYYDLPPVAFGPLPLQPGGPPIWVGGSAEGALRRTVRYGQAWHPVGASVEQVAAGAARLRELAASAGKPAPAIAPRLPMFIGQRSSAAPMSANPQRVLEGEPEELIAALRAYQEAGAAEIVCHFGTPPGASVVGQMERFQRAVMPAFAG